MQIIPVFSVRSVQSAAPVSESFSYTRYASPDRTEVTDSQGWLATFTDGAKSVAIRGASRTFNEQAAASVDVFNRTVTGNWGTSQSGGKWYTSGGSASDYSVDGSVGTVIVTDANASRRLSLANVLQDVTAMVKVRTDKTAYGDEQSPGILLGWQDFENHYIARLDFKPSQVVDNFARVVVNGWGSANTDQSWNVSGSSSDYFVNGSVGAHSVGSVNVSRRTYITSATDFDLRVKVATDVLAQGASLATGLLGRYQDANNHYVFRVRFSPSVGNPVLAAIQKQESGIITTLGSEVTVSGLAHSANTFFWMRAVATGDTLALKVWADGTGEPPGWSVQVADTTFTTSGAVGMRSILLSGNTNILPVLFNYDDFEATLDGQVADTVRVSIQKRVSGTTTTISPIVPLAGVTHQAGDWFNIRAAMTGGKVYIRAWKEGDGEPPGWQAEAADTSFTAGRVGLRAYLEQDYIGLPVVFSYDDLAITGQWPVPPTINHNSWVRLLDTPFAGTVDEAWLRARIADTTPDILASAMQYVNGAPPVVDPLQSNVQIAGNAQYGPLQADGSRQEGADFNDYLGVPWQYGTTTDNPEVSQFRCLDCSGFVRMVYGYKHGLPLTLTTFDGLAIPRVSSNIANSGPGVVIAVNIGAPPSMSAMQPGDIVCFDADTLNPEEEEGQIDHNGIYIGLDNNGKRRFASSRKTISGPTISDLGGPSLLDGTGLYARSLRLVRRF